MLILTRKVNQSVIVTCDHCAVSTKVTVLGNKEDRVRLGFDAPMTVSVWREEIWERICAERLKTAETLSTS